MKKQVLGQWGEQVALEHLVAKGYAIVETNWRVDHFEVDIVAMKDGRLVFVEVKTRKDINSDPLEAVTRHKRSNLVASANAYVKITDDPHEIQFDVIAVRGTPENYAIDHFQDAFSPPLRSY